MLNIFKSRAPSSASPPAPPPASVQAAQAPPISAPPPHVVHAVHGRPISPPFPGHLSEVIFGMGCFWGAERLFWSLSGVHTTAVGYAGGVSKNPTYEQVCSGRTGHVEVVRVIFDEQKISFMDLLVIFWQSHDPTQGNRQGNDRGTQYRSVIYASGAHLIQARASSQTYSQVLTESGYGAITTQIDRPPIFYYAEEYHQQYLHKVPHGYCGLSGCSVSYPREVC